jgi:hypothetical protein
LAEGGPKRLELSWTADCHDLTVTLDGQKIGGPFMKYEVERQAIVTLPDGSILGVLLDTSGRRGELHVSLDGKPLPGSASHPLTRLRISASAIFVVGAVNLILGIGSMQAGWPLPISLGGGMAAAIYGGVMLALGLFALRLQSAVALGFAFSLYLLDGIVAVGVVLMGENFPPAIYPFLFRAAMIGLMWRGFDGISDLKEAQQRPA